MDSLQREYEQRIATAVTAAALHVLLRNIMADVISICKHANNICLGKAWDCCAYYHVYSKDGIANQLEPLMEFIISSTPIPLEDQNKDVKAAMNVFPSYLSRIQMLNNATQSAVNDEQSIGSMVWNNLEHELDQMMEVLEVSMSDSSSSDTSEPPSACGCSFCLEIDGMADSSVERFPDRPFCTCDECNKFIRETIQRPETMGHLAGILSGFYEQHFMPQSQ